MIILKLYIIIIKRIVFFLLFIISYSLFYLSLEKCYNGEDVCCLRINWIKRKIIEEVISCFILIILVELMIYEIISKLNLIHIFFFFIIFYKYSHGMDFHDHGYFNLIGYFIIFIIMFLVLLIFNVILNCIIKKYFSFIKISIIFFFFIFNYNFFFKSHKL